MHFKCLSHEFLLIIQNNCNDPLTATTLTLLSRLVIACAHKHDPAKKSAYRSLGIIDRSCRPMIGAAVRYLKSADVRQRTYIIK